MYYKHREIGGEHRENMGSAGNLFLIRTWPPCPPIQQKLAAALNCNTRELF